MITAGDVVLYRERRWLCLTVDGGMNQAVLRDAAGTVERVPVTEDERGDPILCKVVAQPSRNWLVIRTPTRVHWGPITRVDVPRGSVLLTLTLFEDWMPADPMQSGGPLFFSPELKLKTGEVILLTHRGGQRARLNVPFIRRTVAQHQKAAAPPPPPEEEPEVEDMWSLLRRRRGGDP